MNKVEVGQRIAVKVQRLAHGGKGIALIDARVVFIPGTLPGDTVVAEISTCKKRFIEARLIEVLEPSPDRASTTRCPARAHGAGCCDYSHVSEAAEARLKLHVVLDQLSRIAGEVLSPKCEPLAREFPSGASMGWRTRVRLGVDRQGRAGQRATGSRRIVTDVACAQPVPGMLDGIVGGDIRFKPGTEVIVALDSEGERHVLEARRAPRGQRVERTIRHIEGGPVVRENVGGYEFAMPATSFWQPHKHAPAGYSEVVKCWMRTDEPSSGKIGWDLYGGIGLFVPAIGEALGSCAEIHTVDSSPATQFAELTNQGLSVYRHVDRVENVVDRLPRPDVVVMDPPRQGAGETVIKAVAGKLPWRVIHLGCDPATFARDAKTWAQAGYLLHKLEVFNAFPGTHHMEVLGQFVPQAQAMSKNSV